jgi:hypothetical protein
MDMVGYRWWKSWWGRWLPYARQLALHQQLRNDYLRIAAVTSGVDQSWMDGEARLLMLSQKGVDAVGSEPCQRKFSY